MSSFTLLVNVNSKAKKTNKLYCSIEIAVVIAKTVRSIACASAAWHWMLDFQSM